MEYSPAGSIKAGFFFAISKTFTIFAVLKTHSEGFTKPKSNG
nr:MAG TPA: hypothetical protein [Caudoviricetes sp.]